MGTQHDHEADGYTELPYDRAVQFTASGLFSLMFDDPLLMHTMVGMLGNPSETAHEAFADALRYLADNVVGPDGPMGIVQRLGTQEFVEEFGQANECHWDEEGHYWVRPSNPEQVEQIEKMRGHASDKYTVPKEGLPKPIADLLARLEADGDPDLDEPFRPGGYL
jgi:hypothetical protein